MKLTRYGRREWMGAGVVAIVLLIPCFVLFLTGVIGFGSTFYLSLFIVLVWGAVAGFFRDPERMIPPSESCITSPADGVVRDIELIRGETCDCEELRKLFDGKDMLRVGIFLSVFDVHLNRAPAAMTVSFKHYKMGAFHDARDGRASKENESMIMGGVASTCGIEFPVAVKQISGAIARRIVCPVEAGMKLEKGERYGMIKFGSRTELYLPAGKGIEISVKIGDRVFGGTTVMANILASAKEKTVINQPRTLL